MKKKIVIGLSMVAMVLTVVWAADHIDAPAVGSLTAGSGDTDITDFYAFESPASSDNYVFVCNVQGLTAPTATGDLSFNEDVMYEFNIDTDADQVEDWVIQTIFRDGKVISFGPVAPSASGTASTIENSGPRVEALVTAYGESAEIGTASGIKLFAGSRDDPFFMDFFKFVDIVNGVGNSLQLDVADPADGEAYATSFDASGADTFAGTNVMSVVVEVPKDMIGGSAVTQFDVWAESKRR
ncbi:protein of unknown function [Reichenbachiella faecimaris]|uniref:DUF4331 domain-containing protein n=1 Tax=Reichenbachiella faecimaris TaxID=692418 RepID=A0A1W2G8W9_REIFA|nr:DUF4331 family protein [Reichenbachiella faecimaris]SMD32892.1 protein of unknown function [Reichenbachiella faecimaris]